MAVDRQGMPSDLDKRYVYRGSMITDFNTCPAKFKWRWIDLLAPKRKAFNLEVGTLFHEIMHLWFNNLENPYDILVKFCDDHLASDRVKAAFTEDVIAEVQRLFDTYHKIYPREEFKVLHPEITVIARIDKDYPYGMEMTLDGVIQLPGPKAPVLVLEHKTSKVAKGPLIKAYLRSPQIVSYCWAAKEVLGYNVLGGLYNFMVKTKVPDVIRLPTAVNRKAIERWRLHNLKAIQDIERARERNDFRQNTGKCYSLYGECPYHSLCLNPTSAAYEDFQEAERSNDREELVIDF